MDFIDTTRPHLCIYIIYVNLINTIVCKFLYEETKIV